jgi:hypothetical protein
LILEKLIRTGCIQILWQEGEEYLFGRESLQGEEYLFELVEEESHLEQGFQEGEE